MIVRSLPRDPRLRESTLARYVAISMIEVVDLRSLLPLDREAIAATVKKTNKVIILHEDTKTGGLAGDLQAHRVRH